MQRPSGDYNARITARASNEKLTFYPAYTFKASPTWSKWVKLTCHDVHTALTSHDQYTNITTYTGTVRRDNTGTYGWRDPPLLLFYLNHPIQFIQVIGVVVVLEEYFDKFWLFTVDDSSGATIDITCPKPEKQKPDQATLQPSSKTDSKTRSTRTQDEDTTGEQALHHILSRLTIGTVVQAKGTLTTFRQTRQLSLLRLTILPSTTHELALLSSRSEFYSSTLHHPWNLSREETKKLRLEASGEKEKEDDRARRRRKREQKKLEREERHGKIIEKEYEQEEVEREKGADEARQWGQQLKK